MLFKNRTNNYKLYLTIILTITIYLTISSFSLGSAQPGSWPTTWTHLDSDPVENGCPEHRNIVNTSFALDSEYLYLRMEMDENAGWPGTSGSTTEARYKWWIDTIGGDAYIFGTSVADAEYLLILEDVTNTTDHQTRDRLGELTLMDDFAHSGFTARWNTPATFPYDYVDNDVGSSLWRRVYGSGTPGLGGPQSSMTDPDIGYRLNVKIVDMYVSLEALNHPNRICLIYATDIHNNNLDQAPNCDSPTETDCLGPVPVIDININKTLIIPENGEAEVGDLVVFNHNVTNTGQTNLTYIKLDDTYDPSKLLYINSTITPDETHIHNSTIGHLHWHNLTKPAPYGIGDILRPGESIFINATFLAINSTYPDDTLNQADIIDSEDEFSNHATDSDNATVLINLPPPDISIDKKLVDPPGGSGTVGDDIIFNITVTNTGLTNITKVNMTDTYNSTALEFIDGVPYPDSNSSGLLFWSDLTENFTDLGPGDEFTLTLNFTAIASTNPDTHNFANITAIDENGENDTDTDSASVLIDPREVVIPELDLNKTVVGNPNVVVGDQVTFSVNLTNTGSTPLVNLTLEDTFDPSKLQYVSASVTPNHVHLHSSTEFHLRWDDILSPGQLNETLSPGKSLYLNITCLAVNITDAFGTNNTAFVSDAEDNNSIHVQKLPSDNATVVINLPPPNVLIDKTTGFTDCPLIVVGENVTFTITITNTGGIPLSTVNLTDTYNSTVLEFIQANPSPSDTQPGEIFWEDLTGAGELDPNEELVLEILFKTLIPTATGIGVPDTHNQVLVNASGSSIVNDTDISCVIVTFPPFTPPPEPEPVGGVLIKTGTVNSTLIKIMSALATAAIFLKSTKLKKT